MALPRLDVEELKQKSNVEQLIQNSVRHHDQSSIDWLLSQTAPGFDLTHAKRYTVFHATLCGRLDMLKWLVDVKNCSLHIRDEDGNDPVLLASQKGFLDTLKWLVEVKKRPLNVKNNKGITPVLYASKYGQLETLIWLAENKARPLDERNNSGCDPVLYSVIAGSLPTLKWLGNEKQLSLDISSKHGDDAVLLASQKGFLDILIWLVDVKKRPLSVKSKNGMNPVLYACKYGHLETLQWLVEVKKRSLCVTTKDGMDPLMHAAINGHLHVVKWLIDIKKCSFHVSDHKSCQTLLINARKFKPEIFIFLFPCFLNSLYQAKHLKQALEVAEAQYIHLTDQTQKKPFAEAYEKIIELNYPNEEFKTYLESFRRVDKTAALQLHVTLLMRDNNPQQVMSLCQQTLQGDHTTEEKECATISMAEIIFRYDSLIEKGSPLEKDNDFLSEKYFLKKRAIQAFYLLKDSSNNNAIKLKRRLHEILSGNTTPNINGYSEMTWEKRAFDYYTAYLLYKTNPQSIHLNTVIERFISGTTQRLGKANFFSPKMTPTEKKESRLGLRLSL